MLWSAFDGRTRELKRVSEFIERTFAEDRTEEQETVLPGWFFLDSLPDLIFLFFAVRRRVPEVDLRFGVGVSCGVD